jgi:hypothetical protein
VIVENSDRVRRDEFRRGLRRSGGSGLTTGLGLRESLFVIIPCFLWIEALLSSPLGTLRLQAFLR